MSARSEGGDLSASPVKASRKKEWWIIVGSFSLFGAVFWPFLRHAMRRTAPYITASDSLIQKQISLVEQMSKRSNFSMVDLGSGDGALVLVNSGSVFGSFVA
jgi:hypothetical protein